MKKYEDIYEGKILYTAKAEDFYEHGTDNAKPEGVLSQFTKIQVDYIDGPEVLFKVLEGKFANKIMMWYWYGESNALPEDLLTEDEYKLKSGTLIVNDENKSQVIGELALVLVGVDLKKFELLIQYYETKSK